MLLAPMVPLLDLIVCLLFPLVVVFPRVGGVLFLVLVCHRIEPGLWFIFYFMQRFSGWASALCIMSWEVEN
ncbi:unnamed protein product [Brassica rapa]|uniref:Uncharacterized protein n=1 Tax=Brassica campestris TaxID=3711 RepID=A0A8D9LZ96_BRACM|nr:unnamed protein product [Brassica rapa]